MPRLGSVEVVYKSTGLETMRSNIQAAEGHFKASAAAASAFTVAVAAAVVKFGTDFDAVESRIKASVGNVEKNMGIAKDLFRTGLVSGIEEAGTLATAAIRSFGNETKAEIETSLQFGAAISKQFQIDAPEMFSGVKTLMDNFKISSVEALDLISTGFEKGLNRSGDFLDSINEYATQFRSGGADAGQFFSVLETGLAGGMLGTDKAADAFKEFRVRIQDGSATTEEALAKIGLSVADVNKSLTTGGKSVADVFQDVIGRLGETDDSTIQLQAGVGLLGTQFEDMGTEAVLALNLASSSFDDVAGAASRTMATTQTAQNLFDQLVNEGILIAVEAWDKYEGRVKIALAGTLDFVKANREWPLEMIDNMAGVWDVLNVGFVSLMDAGGTTFIEIQHAGEIAWAAIQDVAGKAVSGMLSGLSKMAEGAAEAYKVLGSFELAGEMDRAAMSIRMVARDVDAWTVNLDKATESRKTALDAHNKIIDAMIDERAQYKAVGDAAKTSGDAVKKIFVEREAANMATTKAIVKNESEKVKSVAILTQKQQKDIESANKKRIAEAEKANAQIVKDRESMAREMEKLDSGQGKALQKQLEASQRLYENFIKDQLGIKELSTESMAALDAQYQEIKDGVLSGEIESFDGVMTDILTLKKVNIEKLKENDVAYAAYLSEQEDSNSATRLKFYADAGIMSAEYYASEKARIQERVFDLEDAGVSAIDIEKWKTGEIQALDIKKLESSDSFFDGMKLGMLESEKDMMTWTDAGRNIFSGFQNELAGSFNQLFTGLIRGDMDSLSGAWDSLWSGMLKTVIDNLSQMAAQWASQQIAGLAIQGASALSSAIFAKEGAFDVGRTGPGQPDPALGGAIPILAHAGESILDAETTEKIKSATGWEEFSGAIREKFGIGENDGGLWDRASEYSGAGANLLKAWQAFDGGDTVGGIAEAMNAMSKAFETYGQQYGSQAASNLGASLGKAAGAVGAGAGAFQAFQDEDYVTGTVQALQTIQQVQGAYNALTATTVAAETGSAAASSAGGAFSSVGYVSGAGYGLVGNAVIGSIMSDTRRAGEENPAMVGKAVSAIVGAAASATGPIGSAILGGIAGQLVGGAISMGGGYSTETYTLTELDAGINKRREFDPERGIGFSGFGVGNNVAPADSHPYANVVNPYLEALDRDTLLINAAIAEITGGLGRDAGKNFVDTLAAQDWSIRSSQRGYEESNFTYKEAGDAISGLSAIAWNNSLDNIVKAATVSGADDEIIRSLVAARRDEVLPTLAEARKSFFEEQAQRQALADQALYSYNTATGQSDYASGGAATGGTVVKEDGILNVTVGEGIIPVRGMEWVEQVGNAFLSAPKNDRPAEYGREKQLENVAMLLTEILTTLTRSESIQEAIASRGGGEIDFDSLAEKLAPALQSGTDSRRFDFTNPDIRRAAETVNQGGF